MESFNPYRAPRASLANPDLMPESELRRSAWVFFRIFPILGCGLVAFLFGLMACYGALALILFGVEWLTGRPEAARVHLLASRSGITATAVMVASGLTAAVGCVAVRRWDACRWRAALVATGGLAVGVAASLGLLTLL